MAQAWGAQRPAAVCRELTKLHEEVLRGDLGTLAARCAADGVRGEVTLVVAGAPAGTPGPGAAATAEPLDDAALAAAVAERVAAGATPKAAVLAVAAQTGRGRREVYDAVVAARHSASAGPTEPEGDGADPA
jgi:16S rRNA (cytidine1402-2'-O)-methyltransferase